MMAGNCFRIREETALYNIFYVHLSFYEHFVDEGQVVKSRIIKDTSIPVWNEYIEVST